MNYPVTLAPISVLIIVLLLFLYWYIRREWLEKWPELGGAWMDREGLTNETAAEIIGLFLHKKNFDARTVQRWRSGENLPNPVTYLRMRRLLSGTSYMQMRQTLDDGTKSYGVLFRRDDASPSDVKRFVNKSYGRSRKKSRKATKQQAKKRRSR